MKASIVESIVELLKEREELNLDEKELKFIASVLGGYVLSPFDIRVFMGIEFQKTIKKAVDMLTGKVDLMASKKEELVN